MTLRLLRHSFIVLFVVATFVTFSNAGVLELTPISGVGDSDAAWVGDDGAGEECFSDNGAMLGGGEAADVAESEEGTEEVIACASETPELVAASPAYGPGDVDGDGYVDGEDIEIIADNWQYGVDGTVTATRAMGDLNGDGKVDGSDVTIAACNWGRTPPVPVPEPSTIVLLLAGFVSLFLARRYRNA